MVSRIGRSARFLPLPPPPPDGARGAKRRLRARARALRRRLAHALPEAPHQAARRFLAETAGALPGTVALYWPDDGEIDPRPLAAALADRGTALALPVLPGGGGAMSFRAWRPGEPLREGAFGIPAPPPSSPSAVPGLVVCPVVAFDRGCRRLGRGGGHYDRALAALGVPAAGLAFAGQEVDRVPGEPHDRPLGLILTESAALRPDSTP